MLRQGLPSDLSPNFSASEEPEGCALLAAGLCPLCGGDSGQGSVSLWGAGVRVPLGSKGAVCTAWVCQLGDSSGCRACMPGCVWCVRGCARPSLPGAPAGPMQPASQPCPCSQTLCSWAEAVSCGPSRLLPRPPPKKY